MKNKSKRFKSSLWIERLVPLLLVILLLALLAVLVISGLALLGALPGA